MLLVDLSASGRFGSVAKLKTEIATELCALLALSAIRNNDKVGLILFTDRIERFVPPQKGKDRALRVIREMLHVEPERRGTDLALALEYLHRISRRRSVAFLLSDFLASGYERALRLARQRHDVIPICIFDRREASLPDLGLIALEDLETGERSWSTAAALPCASSTASSGRRRPAARQRLFRGLGIDPIEVRTDQPYIRPLLRFFRQREKRLREGR